MECLARDAKIAAASHSREALPITSNHQSTPSTPSVGTLHRNHPVASSYRHNRDKLPPPPPPKSSSSKNYGRHSGPKTPPPVSNHKGPSTPPPPPSSSHLHYKRRSRNVQYSPVSDQSGSPKSPKHCVNTASYEAISDTESKHVEDISPVLSTDGKQPTVNKEEDDDNMSLSPISPTDGNSKVELNVQNIIQNALPSSNMNIPTGFSLGPSTAASQNFIPQTFFSQPPANMPTPPPVAPPNFIPPPHPSFNHQLLPPFQGPGPGMHQQNNPILPPVNNMPPQMPVHQNPQQNHLHNEQRSNPMLSISLSQRPSFDTRHKELTEYLQRNHESFVNQQPILPKRDRERNRNRDHQQHRRQNHSTVESPVKEKPSAPSPQSMEGLPFVFQVKAGCARDISQELKRILSKDTLKRLVEQSAFQAFENWWEKQKSLCEPKQQHLEAKEKTDQLTVNVSDSKEITSIEEIQSNTWNKNKQALTEIVQSMFGQDKNFNNPHNSSFLSSFRISRRPSAISNRTKSQQNHHRKRRARAWPSMKEDGRTGKLQRIEESDEEDSDDDDDDDVDTAKNDHNTLDESSSSSDDQFEQFLKQRKSFYSAE